MQPHSKPMDQRVKAMHYDTFGDKIMHNNFMTVNANNRHDPTMMQKDCLQQNLSNQKKTLGSQQYSGHKELPQYENIPT